MDTIQTKYEKSKIDLTPTDWIKIEYKKQDIYVNPCIGLSNKTEIIRNYVETYFKDEDILSNYIVAEYGLILQIVDLCTTIEVSEEGQIIIQIDDLIGSGLWNRIAQSILNYYSVREELSVIVKKIEEQNALNKSIGYTFDRLSDKIFETLDKLMQMDLSEKGISELLGKLKSEADSYNEKFGNNTAVTKRPYKKQKKEVLQ